MFPIAHIAFPLLLLSIFDKIRRANNKPGIPNYYFLIIGLAGILPDLLSVHLYAEGRMSFSHSMFFSMIFLVLYMLLRNAKTSFKNISLLLLVGSASHLILDSIVAPLWPLYPLNGFELNQLVLFPAHVLNSEGTLYANFLEHATWYIFDAIFFILLIITEKTPIVDMIYLKIRNMIVK